MYRSLLQKTTWAEDETCSATRTRNKFLALFAPRKNDPLRRARLAESGGRGGGIWTRSRLGMCYLCNSGGAEPIWREGPRRSGINHFTRKRIGRQVEGFRSFGCAAAGGRGILTNLRNISETREENTLKGKWEVSLRTAAPPQAAAG